MRKVGVVGALAVASVACGGGSSLGDRLMGRAFVSESSEGVTFVPGTKMDVSFQGNRFGASAGCNSLGGPFELDGATLVVTNIGSTGIGCAEPLAAQDAWLETFLGAQPTLTLDEPRLTMATTDASVVLLDRKIAIPDRPLVGTAWTGNGMSDGMSVSFGPGSAAVALTLGADGKVTIATSCQTGTGTFTSDATTIRFSGLTYDGAACANATFQRTSDAVLAVLDGSPVTYVIKENGLTVTKGTSSLLFAAAP
ncbi:MAG TPA: META domain-containing protein [Polyangia bacterium]|nr:META domain-containing protein [Polyangia bacterium]